MHLLLYVCMHDILLQVETILRKDAITLAVELGEELYGEGEGVALGCCRDNLQGLFRVEHLEYLDIYAEC